MELFPRMCQHSYFLPFVYAADSCRVSTRTSAATHLQTYPLPRYIRSWFLACTFPIDLSPSMCHHSCLLLCLHNYPLPCSCSSVSYQMPTQPCPAVCLHSRTQPCVYTAIISHVFNQLSHAMCKLNCPTPCAYVAPRAICLHKSFILCIRRHTQPWPFAAVSRQVSTKLSHGGWLNSYHLPRASAAVSCHVPT
jgi:hypothetical protein